MTRIGDLLDDRFSGLRCKGGTNCRSPGAIYGVDFISAGMGRPMAFAYSEA